MLGKKKEPVTLPICYPLPHTLPHCASVRGRGTLTNMGTHEESSSAAGPGHRHLLPALAASQPGTQPAPFTASADAEGGTDCSVHILLQGGELGAHIGEIKNTGQGRSTRLPSGANSQLEGQESGTASRHSQ